MLSILLVCVLAFPVWAEPASIDVKAVAASPDIVVDLAQEYQEIRGFGGMNHVPWIGDLTPQQRDTAFGNGDGQLGFTVLRIPIDENRANWQREVETARRAIEHGAIVFASPWNPPEYMTERVKIGRSSGYGSTYQEYDNTTLQGTVIESVYGGFSGGGYIAYQDGPGSFAQWDHVIIGSPGTKNIAIRYALESGPGLLDIYLNGELVLEDVVFEATGSWSSWVEKSIQLHMTPGNDNKVRFETKGAGGPNIDRIIVTGYVEIENGRRLRHDMYQEYADYLNEFIDFMKDNGVDLYAISIQNEPDYAYDWTWWTSEEIVRFLREYADQIKTRVIAPESFQYIKFMSDPILEDDRALANMDILGAHLYGTQYSEFSYPLFKEKGAGKELWMTEVYHPNSDMDSGDRWPEALEVARNMHHALVDGEFQAYVWWYIRRGYGPMREDGTISKRGYMMAHYSKFVRPGYVRVDAKQSAPDPELLVSAYKEDDTKAVIVAINRGTTTARQNIAIEHGAEPLVIVSSWVTDGERDLVPGAPVKISGNSFTAEFPAQSVTTFVVEMGEFTADEIADRIGIAQPERGATNLTFLHEPQGFRIEIKSADSDVIQKDGSIRSPASDTVVNVVLLITKLADQTTAERSVSVLVRGIGTIVDLSQAKQTIRGFGAMNDYGLGSGEELTEEERQFVFGNGDGQPGLSILRIPIHEDPEKWIQEVGTAREATGEGVTVIASPWRAPADMVEEIDVSQAPSYGQPADYHAENGTLVNYEIQKTHPGYTGTGYVTMKDGAQEGSVQFNGIIIGIEGTKIVQFQYALESGTSRMHVYVNDEIVRDEQGEPVVVQFEATGSWSIWELKTIEVYMTPGNNNTIKLVTIDSRGPNLDKLILHGREIVKVERLKHDQYGAYVDHLNEFIGFMSEHGVNIDAVSIQNEPDYPAAIRYPGIGYQADPVGLSWTPEEIVTFMKEYAGAIQAKVIAPESYRYAREYTDAILKDDGALENLDILGTHLYGTLHTNYPYPLFGLKGKDKELWMTEYEYPVPVDNWPKALDVAHHIHHSLVEGEFQSYLWRTLKGDNGLLQSDGTIGKAGSVLAHYAKFVRPGFARVETMQTDDPFIYVSAYKSDDQVVIVAINKGTDSRAEKFTLTGGSDNAVLVTPWISNSERTLVRGDTIDIADDSFQAVLSPQSITTFVIDLERPHVNFPPVAKEPVPVQQVVSGETVTFVASDIAEDPDGDGLTITAIVKEPEDRIASVKLAGGTVTVTGVSAGDTSVTVSVSDGEHSLDIIVPIQVSAAPIPTYQLTIVAGTGGKIIEGASGEYEAGTEISIAASANDNYRFKEWTSTGGGSFADANRSGTTFTMPAADTTVTATFEWTGTADDSFSVTFAPITIVSGGVSRTTILAPFLEREFQYSDRAVIRLEDAGVNTYTAVLPASFASSDDSSRTMEIVTKFGTLMIPSDMLDSETAKGAARVEISISRVDPDTLDSELQALVGNRPVVELSASLDGRPLSWNNPDSPIVVTIPYTPTESELADPEHIVVWYIDSTGAVVAVPSGKYDPETGTVTFKTTHFSKFAVTFIKKSFRDIASYAWAVKAIEVMASKGVIDGREDGLFLPAEPVTRGEFMLQLIRALGLSAKADDNFVDVPQDAHYAEAIAIAKALGITNGVGENRFDPAAPITRQDMMTLIVRALDVAQYELVSGTNADLERFADESSIASYARQSMATLVRNGLLQGDGVRLNPLGYTTNAETAVLVYRLYLLMN